MKTLTSPITGQTTAAQSGWCELYDLYLPAAIATPFGTTAILRLATLPNGIAFFTPTIAPEPTGTQGNALAYSFWPLKRQKISGSSKFTSDKLTITASNVTADWANMLDEVDWENVGIVIRKISTTITGATAADCTVIFSGTIDSAKVTLEALQFTCSNDLATFQLTAPRENMHTNCRFNWADDQCTMIRFLPANYKTKTVGTGSTTSNIVSTGLTEDTGSPGSYGTDLVDALADTAISVSSFQNPGSGSSGTYNCTFILPYFTLQSGAEPFPLNQAVVFAGTMPAGLTAGTVYYVVGNTNGATPGFYTVSATAGGSPIVPTTSGSGVTVSWGGIPATFSNFVSFPSTPYFFTIPPGAIPFNVNDAVVFNAATMPTSVVAGQTYYIISTTANGVAGQYEISATQGGTFIGGTHFGTDVTVNALLEFSGRAVKASNTGQYWAFSSTISPRDWGDLNQGYWKIPDGQTGIANPGLAPWIQFDFGSAVTPALWQVAGINTGDRSDLPRLIFFNSSPDGSTWTFESFFECPPLINLAGVNPIYDVLIPAASTNRYWRICIRSRWSSSIRFPVFATVSAYTGSRHYWASGIITFSTTTTTAALQGVSRAILQSYSGQLVCAELPAAPVAGDTFTIERGCDRSFNACCFRKNRANFGGFTSLPFTSITVDP